MSGWLNIFEDDLVCSHYHRVFEALFIEDGDPHRDPVGEQ